MKLLPVTIASLVAGAALGVAMAYVDVGRVATEFTPPPREGESLTVPSGAGAAGPQAAPDEGPIAKVDQEHFDFGTMQRGSTQSHEFQFTNVGTAPLRVEVGSTTCKCTLGEVADRPIEPGETTPVRLEWVAKSQPGEFRQVATVRTNDPRRPSIELTVEGVITETAGLSPEEFLLGRLAADEVGTATVYLATYDKDGPPLEANVSIPDTTPMADRYEFAVEQVAAEDLPMERATSGVKITVKAGPGLPIGYVTEWVHVHTNLPNGEGANGDAERVTLQVPLLAQVEGDISVHGAGWSKERGLLNLGKINSREGRDAKLRLSFKGDHSSEMRAQVASVDPDWLLVELDEPVAIREGVVHQPMTVRVPPGRPSVVRSGDGAENGGVGDGDARIRLSVNHPTTTELDIKVRFVIAE